MRTLTYSSFYSSLRFICFIRNKSYVFNTFGSLLCSIIWKKNEPLPSNDREIHYNCPSTWASRWASLVRVVLLRLLVGCSRGQGCWSCVRVPWAWDSVPGLNGSCSGERFPYRRSLWTTLFNLLTVFTSPLHNSTLVTIHNRRPFIHSLTHSIVFLPFSIIFLTSSVVCPAPSEFSLYICSDDVTLPEPSVSRSVSHFPCCSQSRECSGSFFTWLVGWVTDTPRRLSQNC
jgi:hypothetical protein